MDEDIGRTDDKDHLPTNRSHARNVAVCHVSQHAAGEARKQVWMQFEGKSRPWDIKCGESGEEMGRRWRETNGMGFDVEECTWCREDGW